MSGARRAALGVAVLAAAAGLLIASPALAPDRVDGTAQGDWPAPPGVGNCLNLPERDVTDIVDCDGPHDAEVTRSWAATDPQPAQMDEMCGEAARGYLGIVGAAGNGAADRAGGDAAAAGGGSVRAVASWQPSDLRFTAFPVESLAAEWVGWRACVIRPAIPVRYLGTVAGAAPTGLNQTRVPEAYRTCLDAVGNLESCTLPHISEVIAVGTVVTDSLLPSFTFRDGTVYSWDDQGKPEDGRQPVDQQRVGTGQEIELSDEQMAALSASLLDSRLALDHGGMTLTGMCADLAPGLVPAAVPAPSSPRVRVGLSTSTVALGDDGGDRGMIVFESGSTPVVSALLGMGEQGGYRTVRGACAVTAPEGTQFTRSVLGWEGPLPVIPGR